MAARRRIALHPAFQALLENNLANKDRINYLRALGKQPVAYLARGRKKDAAARRWSRNIKIRVMAPEEDTSVYYGSSARERARGFAFAATEGAPFAASAEADDGLRWDFKAVPRAVPGDQLGLSSSEFERLRRTIREDGVAAALH